MDISISGKVVLVTGAGRGIGRSLAVGLAAEGARTAIMTRNADQGDRLAEEIGRSPGAGPVLPVVADVGDEGAVAEAVRRIDRQWGRIDALVHNAGWMPPASPVLDTDVTRLRGVLDTNLVGSFLLTKHVAPVMIRGGGGRIVYISSMIGVQANQGLAAYGASKAGLNILNNVVHRELANQGIRTVALAPGLTDTPGMRASVGEEYITTVAASYPGGRIGRPEDILALTVFLCSDAAQHISGTLIPVRPVTG
ncbi:short-chain dehydrogenase [Planotetraspora thailandica]|uniref:Short-chain dehydrogenase n=1 Tax=Planotetraspora thailandica TaxID=487172 RepID=A0A8J3XWP7_9ACTN|nr:SDR family oxidoreductase [Planotetraspora thailandica]GII54951.1 short-chain dehydrogenase [Planotetraspora thailandica]